MGGRIPFIYNTLQRKFLRGIIIRHFNDVTNGQKHCAIGLEWASDSSFLHFKSSRDQLPYRVEA